MKNTSRPRCKKCKKEFEKTHHLQKYCIKCRFTRDAEKNRERARNWYHENKDRARENGIKWRKDNPEKWNKIQREYHKKHPEHDVNKILKKHMQIIDYYIPDEFNEYYKKIIKNNFRKAWKTKRSVRLVHLTFENFLFGVILHCIRKYQWDVFEHENTMRCLFYAMQRKHQTEGLGEDKRKWRNMRNANKVYKKLCEEIPEYEKVRKEYVFGIK